MNTETRLREAIETGEVLKMIYHGGSCSGSMRDIAPISLKDGKLRARCYQSGSVKTFVLIKIELVDNPNNRPEPEWRVSPEVKYMSLESMLGDHASYLEGLGWHVSHADERVSLHGKLKNGSPKKGALVSIDFSPTWGESIINADNSIDEVVHQSEKPWCVRGKDQQTRNYKYLDRAIETFLSYAELLAPANKVIVPK